MRAFDTGQYLVGRRDGNHRLLSERALFTSANGLPHLSLLRLIHVKVYCPAQLFPP